MKLKMRFFIKLKTMFFMKLKMMFFMKLKMMFFMKLKMMFFMKLKMMFFRNKRNKEKQTLREYGSDPPICRIKIKSLQFTCSLGRHC